MRRRWALLRAPDACQESRMIMDALMPEAITLARFYHPIFMTRPVYCPADEILFYALHTCVECAHALHISTKYTNSVVALEAVMALLHCDPCDTMQLVTELLQMGFHVSCPITGRYIPEDSFAGPDV